MKLRFKQTGFLGERINIEDYALSHGEDIVLHTEEKTRKETIDSFIKEEKELIKLALKQLEEIEKYE